MTSGAIEPSPGPSPVDLQMVPPAEVPTSVTAATVSGLPQGPRVLLVTTNGGGAAYAFLTPDQALGLAENIRRVAVAARTGLVLGQPGPGGNDDHERRR